MQSIPSRILGRSGLKVSVFGFGNWITGHGHKQEDIDNQVEIIKEAFNAGINYFDTAEVYGYGNAETIMGIAMKQIDCTREQLVISTKLFWGAKKDTKMSINQVGLSRKHIIEGMNNSLKRLQLDYVDIVFCHRPDYQTPLEETCRAMSSLIDNNKAFYWGTSEWSAADIAASIEICERLNLHKPIADQCQYNLLSRDRFEKEYRSLYERYQYGTTIWSPLQGGILAGKYNDGEIPEGSRYDQNQDLKGFFNKVFSDDNKQKSIKMFKELKDLAEELGYSQAQLALAWTVMNTDVSVCILGASSLRQLQDNLGALEICKKWTPEIEQRIEKIMGNAPEAERDFRTWIPRTQRRQEALWDVKL